MMRASFLALAILVAATACDRGPNSNTVAPEADTPVAEAVDLASHAGQNFDAFVGSPGMDRFSLEKLDLAPNERTRLAHAMTVLHPSRLISGGGAQALVFTGCGQTGCDASVAVMAIGSRGETFVGVRDAEGASEFIPDDRMEALLRLNSPARNWDDPGLTQPPSDAPPP